MRRKPVEPGMAEEKVKVTPTEETALQLVPGEITEKPLVSSDDRLLSALMWLSMVLIQLPLLSVVLLLIEPNKHNPFQRHHAVSSIIFWVVALIYEGVATIAFTCRCDQFGLPGDGGCDLLRRICGVVLYLKAFNGEEVEIPFRHLPTAGWLTYRLAEGPGRHMRRRSYNHDYAQRCFTTPSEFQQLPTGIQQEKQNQ
jgi:uncharacterized membrane protein